MSGCARLHSLDHTAWVCGHLLAPWFGIVGLPVPDEWLLTFSGYLVFKNTLSFVPTFFAAFLGSACGLPSAIC
jgi:membrane protein DedA with SNARE-associated domain